jgi:hypothetical protein
LEISRVGEQVGRGIQAGSMMEKSQKIQRTEGHKFEGE